MASARCYACRRTLLVTFFGRDAYKASGRPSICLECERAKSRRYYAENRERILAKARARPKPQKPCSRCGRFTPSPRHSYCEVCGEAARLERASRYDKKKPSTTAGGWGYTHQRARARVARQVDAGLALCARCGLPIAPGSKWHLDHTDDRSGYLGPSHARCNARAAALKSNRRGGSREW